MNYTITLSHMKSSEVSCWRADLDYTDSDGVGCGTSISDESPIKALKRLVKSMEKDPTLATQFKLTEEQS